MSRLDELKSSPDVGLAEYPVKVCVSAKLIAELDAADLELLKATQAVESARAALELARDDAADPDAPKRPRRSGQSPHADLTKALEDAEKRAEDAAGVTDAIRERMERHSVTLTLRGKTSGEWRRWVAEHPPRDETAEQFCNLDDLIGDLHLWVAKYDDEDPTEAWWEFVSANGAPAHMREAAHRLILMHERDVDLGKSRRDWLTEWRSANASA